VTAGPNSTFGEALEMDDRTGYIVSPRIDAAEPLSLEPRDFCAAVTVGTTPRSAPSIGLEVLPTIGAVDQLRDLGGATVTHDGRDSRLSTVSA
jgi:hypothetical protein